jgi:hypothetical protein
VTGSDDVRTGDLDHVRVCDADRDRALAELRDGFADGRLTQDTFSFRVSEALRARVGGDLRILVADLPGRRRLGFTPGFTARTAWRRALRATDRWLRGWPPVLPLPSGGQYRFTIGREPECDMTLCDLTVSRWHASLQRDAGEWLLADLGSTNGTRLNGWKVRAPVPVRAGDLVSFGAVTFVLAERPGWAPRG